MILSFDQFELDPDKPELRRAGKPVKADAVVLRLLVALVRDAGRLVTKQELLAGVWEGRSVSENVITVAMARLRRTLSREAGAHEFVVNVHGQGYRFERPVTVHDAPKSPASADARASSAPSAPAHPTTVLSSVGGSMLVGRDRALDRLRAELAAVRAGRGAMCVVSGEAGIGKTRVAEAFAHEASALGCTVAWGYCHEGGRTPPLWPFVQLLRDLLPSAVNLHDPRVQGALPELTRLLPELSSDTGQRDPQAVPFDQEPSGRHRMFDAIVRVITAAAERTPCLLVLDDLHRADAPSLELLRYFIDEIARTRVLVLATLRSEPPLAAAPAARLSSLLGHRNCARIALERLRASDVAAYVSALLDDRSGALSRAVFDKSEGNPFFMIELSRQLLDSERPSGELLSVPVAALELVRQRVAALDGATRGVLSCAAVIGRSFELPVLQAAVDSDAAGLMASLDDALASEVVIAALDSKTAFSFGHELLRTALYDALSPPERRSWHARVAQALHELVQAGTAVTAAELAHHFFSALPASDLRLTVRYCAQAATACAEVYAYADAARHLRHAREALALIERPSQRLRVDLMLRQAMYARVDASPEFGRLIREVIDVSRKQQLGAPLALGALMLDLHPGFPPLAGARSALEDALSLLAPDDAIRSAVSARLSTAAPLAFDAQRSTAQAEAALAQAERSGFLLGKHTAHSALLYLMGGPGHEERAAQLMRELEDSCRSNPVQMSVAPMLLDMHRAIVAAQRGERQAMHDALERCTLRGQRVGSRDLTWHADRCRVLSRIDARSCALSAEDAAELRALHQRAAQSAFVGTDALCAYDRCVVLARGTELDAAERSALAFDLHDPPSVWAFKLRALAAAGLHDEVRLGLRAVPPERLALLPRDRDYLGTLGALARVTLAIGAREYAAPLRQLLAPHAGRLAINVTFVSEGTVEELVEALG